MSGLSLAIFGLSACARPLMNLPSGPARPAPDATAIVDRASAACRGVRTLTAEMRVGGAVRGRKIRGRLIAGLAAPASFRFEALAPFGAPVFVFVAAGERATLLLVREGRVLRDAPPDRVLEALTGVPFGPADLRDVLDGCGAPATSVRGGRVYGDRWLAAELADGSALYLRHEARDPQGWHIVAANRATGDAATAPIRIEYRDIRGGVPYEVRLHHTRDGRVDFDLTVKLSQVETNVAIDAAAFAVDVPAGAAPMTIDEVRAGGVFGSFGSSGRGR